MRNFFKPAYYYPDVFSIAPESLKERGIKLLLLDMDNTLVSAVETHIPEYVKNYVQAVKRAGIKPVVMSNNISDITEKRCRQLDIDFFSFCVKPLKIGYKKILRKYGFTPEETAAVGDQVLTDIAGANRMGILTILVDPLSNDNNIFGKGVKLISRSLCRLLKDMPRKGEYYGEL